jgi:hypothetical protein
MFIFATTDYPAKRPEMTGTLWHCQSCDSFVSIYSAQVVRETLCPMCLTVELELCGTFESFLGRQFTDA